MANPKHVHQGNNAIYSGPEDPDCFICKSIQKEAPQPILAPLSHRGVIIGAIKVDPDGHTWFHVEESEEAHEFAMLIRRGTISHISLETHDK